MIVIPIPPPTGVGDVITKELYEYQHEIDTTFAWENELGPPAIIKVRPFNESKEILLWLAVFECALRDLAGMGIGAVGNGADEASAKLAKEARDWFYSDRDKVGSFIFCCRVLDLNPKAVRSAIARQGAAAISRRLGVKQTPRLTMQPLRKAKPPRGLAGFSTRGGVRAYTQD